MGKNSILQVNEVNIQLYVTTFICEFLKNVLFFSLLYYIKKVLVPQSRFFGEGGDYIPLRDRPPPPPYCSCRCTIPGCAKVSSVEYSSSTPENSNSSTSTLSPEYIHFKGMFAFLKNKLQYFGGFLVLFQRLYLKRSLTLQVCLSRCARHLSPS